MVRKEITTLQILIFAAMTGPLATAGIALTYIAPFYTQVVGFSLGSVGLVITFCRCYDIVADIAIAYVSDNTRSRFGKRKLWVVIGIAAYIPAAWLLYVPPATVTIEYFALALFLFFSAWTVAFIPALTQATELSTRYETANRINVAQALVTQAAIIATVGLPFLLVDGRNSTLRARLADLLAGWNFGALDPLLAFLRLPTAHGGEVFQRDLQIVATAVVGLTPILLLLYLLFVPAQAAGPAARQGSIMAALRNRVFQRFATGYFFIMCGSIGQLSLFPFVAIHALQLPDSFLLLFMVQQLVGIFTTPLLRTVMARFERSTCVVLAAGCAIAGLCLQMVIPVGNEPLALVAMLVMGLPGQAIYLVPNLIAGDCADFARWKTGTESRAVHTSLVSSMIKIGAVMGALLLWLVSLAGFDPSRASPSGHDVLMLKFYGLAVPAALLAIGAAIVFKYPLTRRRHAAIVKRIAARNVPDQAGLIASVRGRPFQSTGGPSSLSSNPASASTDGKSSSQ